MFANIQFFIIRKFQLLLSLESVHKPLPHLSDFEGLHLRIIVGWGMGILRYKSACFQHYDWILSHISNSEINISRSSKIDRSFFIQVWFLHCNCMGLSSFYEAIKAHAVMLSILIYVFEVHFQNMVFLIHECWSVRFPLLGNWLMRKCSEPIVSAHFRNRVFGL